MSLAALIGVPEDGRPAFLHLAQSRYSDIYADGIEPIDSVHRLIRDLGGPARLVARAF